MSEDKESFYRRIPTASDSNGQRALAGRVAKGRKNGSRSMRLSQVFEQEVNSETSAKKAGNADKVGKLALSKTTMQNEVEDGIKLSGSSFVDVNASSYFGRGKIVLVLHPKCYVWPAQVLADPCDGKAIVQFFGSGCQDRIPLTYLREYSLLEAHNINFPGHLDPESQMDVAIREADSHFPLKKRMRILSK